MSFKQFLTRFLGICILLLIISLIGAFPIKWLWNWLIPSLFNGPRITIKEAFGLFWLVRAFLPGVDNSNKK